MNELTRRIGKFDSPESLLKAYNALSKEFARRAARLKDYEKENARLLAESKDEERLKQYAKNALNDQSFLEQNVLPLESVKSRVIDEYLTSLKNLPAPQILSSQSGSAVLTPPSKPRSLKEAKRLADILLNS